MPADFNPMAFNPAFAMAALIAFAAGVVAAWLFARARIRAATQLGRAARDAEVAQLVAEREAAGANLRRVEQLHAAGKVESDALRDSLFKLGNERATLSGRIERLAQVDADLAAARAEAQKWREECQRAEQRLTETATRLHEHRQATADREQLLAHVREEFSDRFKSLANDLLEEKSRKFSEQNQAQIGTLLNPLREQLGDFRKRVDDVYDKDSRERSQLKAEIEALKNLNQRISDDATNLTRALKGDSRTQGAWGVLVLVRLLEASGLEKGRAYDTQTVLRNEAGGRPRPDVIVHLPEGRDIIIDAKVSLTAYERYCAAADENERGAQLAAHVASMRTHVKDLAERRYSDLAGVNSLEFVLMFVPVEAAYIEAVHHDDALHAFALERQVAIVTTSTLLATLQTVKSLWRFDDRNRNAIEIADRAGKLYDKFVGFVGDIEDAANKIEGARAALASASGKLTSGRGNLVGQADKLRELGAKANKALPPELVERAQIDEVQPRLASNDEEPGGKAS
jgi:DNA recombination protein RmuC